MAENLVKTVCGMCGVGCGLDITVEDGRAVKVQGMKEHVMRQPCRRGAAVLDFLYHPDRLKTPLIKENGKFREIGWEEALNRLTENLRHLQTSGTPEALGAFFGDQLGLRETRHLPKVFFKLFGSPNLSSGASHCHYANEIGMRLTLGRCLVPSLRGAKCIILWGTNPNQSGHPMVDLVKLQQQEGTKLIVIDPRKIPLAKQADYYLPIKPGTDGTLALAMLNVIIGEGLYDKDFVDQWAVGFDELTDHIKQYTPDQVASITGIDAVTIREVARLYATQHPASIVHFSSLEHHVNGVQTIRAVSCLIAITGNYDLPGGNAYVDSIKFNTPPLSIGPNFYAKRLGQDKFPLFNEIVDEVQAACIVDTLINDSDPKIKTLIVQGANPMASWPDTQKTRRALEKLDFLVVMDVFMTETAELAHMVLPAATFLERVELIDYGYFQTIPLLFVTNKVVDPLPGVWPDWKLWMELAKRLNLTGFYPGDDIEEMITFQLNGTGYSIKDIRDSVRGVFYQPKVMKRYLKEGFQTPSGKVELYSTKMVKAGVEPLPTWKEIPAPGDPDQYPLRLTTGARNQSYTHSQFHNILSLRKAYPEPTAEIHQKTAGDLGIQDGDKVFVETIAGRTRLNAVVTEDIREDVVQVTHGWPGDGNANLLIDDMVRDNVSGFPAYKSKRCRLIRAS